MNLQYNKNINLMNCFKITIISFFSYFIFCCTAFSKEEISAADLERFGWEYVGKTVSLRALIGEFYAARRGENKGHVAPWLIYEDKFYDVALFDKKFKSQDLKPFLNACVSLTGIVQERDFQTEGVVSKKPTLLIKEIEFDFFCK